MYTFAVLLSLLTFQAAPFELKDLNYEIDVPVQCDFDAISSPSLADDGSYELSVETDGLKQRLPVQRSNHVAKRIHFILPASLAKTNQSFEMKLIESDKKPVDSPFAFKEKDEKRLGLYEDGKPVFVYNHGMIPNPNVSEERYHSCFVHPIYGLDGEILTDDYPRDHYHHRGLYCGWPRIRIGDKIYDNWSLTTMSYRFEKWLYKETGPVCAMLGTQSGCYVGEKKVMEEITHYVIYRAGDTGRVMDVQVQWKAVGQPLTILGEPNKGYGGFNLRFGQRQDTQITTSTGLQKRDVLHDAFPWADLSARFNDRDSFSGIAVFQDEENIDYPSIWLLRHYGFIGVCWPGMQTHQLSPDDDGVTMNYRLWIHRNGAVEGKTKEAYDAFVHVSQ